MATVPVPMRGEIWPVDFDPAVGAEIQLASCASWVRLLLLNWTTSRQRSRWVLARLEIAMRL